MCHNDPQSHNIHIFGRITSQNLILNKLLQFQNFSHNLFFLLQWTLVDRYIGLSDEEFQTFFRNPGKLFDDAPCFINSCFGHAISFGPFTRPIIFDSHNFEDLFSSFDQLTHLKSLDCVINNYKNDNTQVLDEFGSVFGPKLVHLSISFNDTCTFSSNQLEDCFSQFTRLKHLVLHRVPKFHPSFH